MLRRQHRMPTACNTVLFSTLWSIPAIQMWTLGFVSIPKNMVCLSNHVEEISAHISQSSTSNEDWISSSEFYYGGSLKRRDFILEDVKEFDYFRNFSAIILKNQDILFLFRNSFNPAPNNLQFGSEVHPKMPEVYPRKIFE